VTTREFSAVETRQADASTAEQAAQQAAEVASTASDAAGQVVQETGEQLRQVGGAVREQVTEVTDQVATEGKRLLEDAKSTLHQQAQTETERIADALRKVGDQLTGMLAGQAPEEGPVRDYVEQASSKVNEFAGRLRQRGFDGMVSDAERFARRRPGAFLLGAAAAGALVGRVLRGTKSDHQGNGSSQLSSGMGNDRTEELPLRTSPTAQSPIPGPTVVTPPAPPIMPSTPRTPGAR